MTVVHSDMHSHTHKCKFLNLDVGLGVGFVFVYLFTFGILCVLFVCSGYFTLVLFAFVVLGSVSSILKN